MKEKDRRITVQVVNMRKTRAATVGFDDGKESQANEGPFQKLEKARKHSALGPPMRNAATSTH